jgi:hypothetical protein
MYVMDRGDGNKGESESTLPATQERQSHVAAPKVGDGTISGRSFSKVESSLALYTVLHTRWRLTLSLPWAKPAGVSAIEERELGNLEKDGLGSVHTADGFSCLHDRCQFFIAIEMESHSYLWLHITTCRVVFAACTGMCPFLFGGSE